MKLGEYKNYFISWIDKGSLVTYINDLIKDNINPKWNFGMRSFWKCPIKNIGKDPLLLPIELRNIIGE